MNPARTSVSAPASAAAAPIASENSWRDAKSPHGRMVVGMRARCARSSASMPSRSVMTRVMTAPRSGASINAWRLVPEPEASTAILMVDLHSASDGGAV